MNARAEQSEPDRFNELPQAPPASKFAAHPAAWYLVCHVNDLRRGPLARRMLGRDLVAFRTASEKVAVLDARCAHLGANLAHGEVIGETIQCPFHNWRYGCDGRCERIPATAGIPAFARQQSFPVAVRHGFLFFFNAAKAFYDLPFIEGENPDELVAGQMFSYTADAEWFMVASQGFDSQHFQTVHERRLLRPPEFSSPNPFMRATRYHAENIGESWRDRSLRSLVGPTVTLTVQNWGGTFYTVKAEFPRACSRFIVSFRPLEDRRTHFDVIVFAPRGLGALGLPLRRWFTKAHLKAEAAHVRQSCYRPARLIAADADMIRCFQWLAALPQQPQAIEPDRAGLSVELETIPSHQ